MLSQHARARIEQLSRSPVVAGYLKRLGVASQRTMSQVLERVMELLRQRDTTGPWGKAAPWHTLTAEDVQFVVEQMHDKASPATINKTLAALRGVMREALRLKLISNAHYESIEQATQQIPVGTQAQPTALNVAQVKKLLAEPAVDAEPAVVRNTAIISLLLACGMRRAEVCELDLGDYDAEFGRLRIGRTNAEKDRTIKLGRLPRQQLARWLEVRGGEAGPLMLPLWRGGHLRRQRMTDQAVYDLVRIAGASHNIANLTSRRLRQTCIIALLAAGVDLTDLQAILGHASWMTTNWYVQFAAQANRRLSEYVTTELIDLSHKGGNLT